MVIDTGAVLSRSLIGFVSFCLVLAFASAIGVWYMGPTLAGIALDSESRENPYYLLHLMVEDAVGPEGAAAAESAPGYGTAFLTLAASDGAELQWRAGQLGIAEGSPLLAVDQAQLLRFPTGGDLVQMLTGSHYRRLQKGRIVPPAQLLGSLVKPASFPMHGAIVLALLRMKDDVSVAAIGSPNETGWLALLGHYDGRVIWNAPLDAIRASESWNRVLALHFPSQAAADAWLTDPTTMTERAIAERVIEDALLLVANQRVGRSG